MSHKESQKVSVYGKPGCVQCKYTLKQLEKHNVPYNYIDISVNEVAAERVKDLGYTNLPVVDTGTDHWSGLKLDKIKEQGQLSLFDGESE